ncbi:MAG: hypothetical protein NW226_14175 [Microscillaceae bacterium]|nr:hypothetical protein [Microscillaceae bacterium]
MSSQNPFFEYTALLVKHYQKSKNNAFKNSNIQFPYLSLAQSLSSSQMAEIDQIVQKEMRKRKI